MDSGINSSQNSGTQQIKKKSLNSDQEEFAATGEIKSIPFENSKKEEKLSEIYIDLSRFSSTVNPEMMKSDGDYQKPPLSYRFLITLALKSKKSRCIKAKDIAEIIKSLFPYFKDTHVLWIQSMYRTLALNGTNSNGSKSKVKNCFRRLPNSEIGGRAPLGREEDIWTFENKLVAAELDKDLRLEFISATNYNGRLFADLAAKKTAKMTAKKIMGSENDFKVAEIKAASPMPNILEQIVQEPIDLQGNQIEVSII